MEKKDRFICPVLLLAAGRSRRMRGDDKLLQPVDGVAILRSRAKAALATGQDVIVVLPSGAQEAARRDVLDGLPLRIVTAQRAEDGMSASLVTGLAAMPVPSDAVMILLGDLPELQAEDLRRVMSAARAEPHFIWRGASDQGHPGHPVVFPARFFDDLAAVTGDSGASGVIRAHSGDLRLCPLPGQRAVTDLDTPEDWAAWRAARGDGDPEK